MICSIDGTCSIQCPTLIECNDIPNITQEIPTPAVTRHYKHLNKIEQFIPEYDPDVRILLLLGRDITSPHHVLDQRIGPGTEPFAQRLRLGWVVVDETCLGMVHTPDVVSVNKTHVARDGRDTLLSPCPNNFVLKDKHAKTNVGDDVFQRTENDDEPGLSQEDKEFMTLMSRGFTKTSRGNWSAPLPFRKDRPRLPSNYVQDRQRAENLGGSLQRDPTKNTTSLNL